MKTKKTTGKGLKIYLDEPATIYSISVTALFAVQKGNIKEDSQSNPSKIIGVTAPDSPSDLIVLTTFTNTKVCIFVVFKSILIPNITSSFHNNSRRLHNRMGDES